MTVIPLAAELGARALLLLFIWLGSSIIAAELSRSKGYGERPGLGTGLLLSFFAPIIWLLVPAKDPLAEWHQRKPWQRRKRVRESDMTAMGTSAGDPSSRPVKSSGAGEAMSGGRGDQLGG
jgi:hypothetical protein